MEDSINYMTEKMKDMVLESAAEILDKRKKINKSWVTDDILGLCDTMRELKKKKHLGWLCNIVI